MDREAWWTTVHRVEKSWASTQGCVVKQHLYTLCPPSRSFPTCRGRLLTFSVYLSRVTLGVFKQKYLFLSIPPFLHKWWHIYPCFKVCFFIFYIFIVFHCMYVSHDIPNESPIPRLLHGFQVFAIHKPGCRGNFAYVILYICKTVSSITSRKWNVWIKG